MPRRYLQDLSENHVGRVALPPPLTADRMIGAVPLAYPPRYTLGCGPTVPVPLLHPAPLRTTYTPTRIEGVKSA